MKVEFRDALNGNPRGVVEVAAPPRVGERIFLYGLLLRVSAVEWVFLGGELPFAVVDLEEP